MTHICVSKLTITSSDNGLSPERHQAIISTNTGILLMGPLGTNFREILIKFYTFLLKKCIWKCRLVNGGHFVSALMCSCSRHGCVRMMNMHRSDKEWWIRNRTSNYLESGFRLRYIASIKNISNVDYGWRCIAFLDVTRFTGRWCNVFDKIV